MSRIFTLSITVQCDSAALKPPATPQPEPSHERNDYFLTPLTNQFGINSLDAGRAYPALEISSLFAKNCVS